MIKINRNLVFNEIWNPIRISYLKYPFYIYRWCKIDLNLLGFQKRIRYSLQHNLLENEELIFRRLTKTTQYDVRRAKKDGVVFSLFNTDYNIYVKNYNKFVESKPKLKPITNKFLIKNKNNLIITAAELNGEKVVFHSYVVDYSNNIAILLHTFSHFRLFSKEEKQVIGRANKFLHFEDMKYLKQIGFEIYDWG